MTYNIVYATDKNYFIPTYISMYSLIKNNESDINIHLISGDLPKQDHKRLMQLKETNDHVSISNIPIDGTQFSHLPSPKHFSEGIYYRLLIDSILPLQNERVLYIDADTIIRGSIAGIFETNMNKSAVAATPHYKLTSYFYDLPIEARWFNTGVLFIDLKEWRENNIEQKIKKHISEGRNLSEYPIQKILNNILSKSDLWKPLDPKYNYMEDWIQENEYHYNKNIDPRIVHFMGSYKPWKQKTVHTYKDEWWELLSETAYAEYKPPDEGIKSKLINFVDSASYKYTKRRISPKIDDIIKSLS